MKRVLFIGALAALLARVLMFTEAGTVGALVSFIAFCVCAAGYMAAAALA